VVQAERRLDCVETTNQAPDIITKAVRIYEAFNLLLEGFKKLILDTTRPDKARMM
jgi:hypothetical protein